MARTTTRQRATPASAEVQALRAARARKLVLRYRNNPVLFALEVLGIECWKRQAELLMAVARGDRVAVRSGHKTGKSLSIAILTFWWLATRFEARVVLTSSGGRQVAKTLWTEITKASKRRKEVRWFSDDNVVGIGGRILETPSGGLTFLDSREAFGFSTDTPETMAGYSGANQLFLIDEASGVDDAIYDTIEGNLAGGGKCAAFSNPTQTTGWFFEAFHGQSDLWHGLRISSEETPNASGEGEPIKGLATRKYIERQQKKAGGPEKCKLHPIYQVRVLGEFPSAGACVIVPLYLVEAAEKRWADRQANESEIEGRLIIGVDPAREGDDDSSWTPRRGTHLYMPESASGLEGEALAEKVLETVEALARPNEIPLIIIDPIGVGASPHDFLKKSKKIEVVGIKASERAHRDDKYNNKRTELLFDMSDWLENDGDLPPDKEMRADLLATKYSIDGKNRQVAEAKKEVKKRLKRSPDKGDSACLAVCKAKPRARVASGGATYSDFDDTPLG